ncbi:MAG: hypothetical protein Q9218_005339 [Villophora microphyllina]
MSSTITNPCGHPACPLHPWPHHQGIYLHNRCHPNYTFGDPDFGLSNPPPEIWIARERVYGQKGTQMNYDIVQGFIAAHRVDKVEVKEKEPIAWDLFKKEKEDEAEAWERERQEMQAKIDAMAHELNGAMDLYAATNQQEGNGVENTEEGSAGATDEQERADVEYTEEEDPEATFEDREGVVDDFEQFEDNEEDEVARALREAMVDIDMEDILEAAERMNIAPEPATDQQDTALDEGITGLIKQAHAVAAEDVDDGVL